MKWQYCSDVIIPSSPKHNCQSLSLDWWWIKQSITPTVLCKTQALTILQKAYFIKIWICLDVCSCIFPSKCVCVHVGECEYVWVCVCEYVSVWFIRFGSIQRLATHLGAVVLTHKQDGSKLAAQKAQCPTLQLHYWAMLITSTQLIYTHFNTIQQHSPTWALKRRLSRGFIIF